MSPVGPVQWGSIKETRAAMKKYDGVNLKQSDYTWSVKSQTTGFQDKLNPLALAGAGNTSSLIKHSHRLSSADRPDLGHIIVSAI